MAVPAVVAALGKKVATDAAKNVAISTATGGKNGGNDNKWMIWVAAIVIALLLLVFIGITSVFVGIGQMVSPSTVTDDICVVMPDSGDSKEPPTELDPDAVVAGTSETPTDEVIPDVNELEIYEGRYVFPLTESSYSTRDKYNDDDPEVAYNITLESLTGSTIPVLSVGEGVVVGSSVKDPEIKTTSNNGNAIAVTTRTGEDDFITVIYRNLLGEANYDVGDTVNAGANLGNIGRDNDTNDFIVRVEIHDESVPLDADYTTTVNPQTWLEDNSAQTLGNPSTSERLDSVGIYGDDWQNSSGEEICRVNDGGTAASTGGGGNYPSGGVSNGGWGGHSNGMIPESEMSTLASDSSEMLRSDAAAAFDQMNEAFKERFGYDIYVTDSYRSYAQQVDVKARKGWLAATPGTSNHGWGLALDLGSGINSFYTSQHTWMKQNSYKYGWIHPGWAQQGGSKPEAWHWEYVGVG